MKSINSKQWIKINLTLLLILTTLFVGFNYIIDPYGYNNSFHIQRINSNKTQTEAQSRKFKLKLAEQTDFNGLFLGGSEMTFLGNTDYMSKLTNIKFFNLACNEQEIYESYMYLKYILSIKKIKYVVLGLHPFKFNKSNDDYRQDTPENIINKKGNLETYLSYKTFIDSLKTLYKNYEEFPTIYNKTGWKIVNRLEYYKVPKNKQREWIRQKVEDNPQAISLKAKSFVLDFNKIDYLQKIITLCEKNNIKLQLLFTPIYYKHFINMYTYMEKDINTLKYLIAQKKSFYDFSNINVITLDYMNFLDRVSHCNQRVSYPIVDALVRDKYYKDFGKFVTKQNVEKFIESSSANLHKYKQLLKNP